MDELIRKQDALDAIHCNITVTGRQNAELVAATIGAFADRIKALPPVVQPEMTDEQFKDYCRKRCLSVVTNEFMEDVHKMVPPVQPKHGKWIERGTWSEGYGMGESYGKYWACDQCGREVKGFWNECGNNFCSNCGADMRGGEK